MNLYIHVNVFGFMLEFKKEIQIIERKKNRIKGLKIVGQ